MDDKWAKLNTNWMDSDWLIVLSAESRLAWVQLICYAKAHGTGGRVKAKSALVFGRQNFLGEESVEQVLRAAKTHGALIEEDGVWILTGWKKHQGDETAAERMARMRSKGKAPKAEPKQTEDEVTDVTRNARNVTQKRREEKREEEKRQEESNYNNNYQGAGAKEPTGDGNPVWKGPSELEVQVFFNKLNAKTYPNVEPDVTWRRFFDYRTVQGWPLEWQPLALKWARSERPKPKEPPSGKGGQTEWEPRTFAELAARRRMESPEEAAT